ncbi:MAG: (4Fe-4S)-binding protein [Methanobacteriota archaeon]|nr:MAG: (4Fe-4S)-binding protein [Euryarchaeota archaeon]
MIVSVASGKGGTGKTTVATNLALVVGDAQLVDCDVEEPNCHIFFDVPLRKVADVCVQVPVVDLGRCSFCGRCAEFCQYNAIAVFGEKVMIFEELCHGCGGCKLVCPDKAIHEKPRRIGVVERGADDGLELVQGRLDVGEPIASPIIRETKRFIDRNRFVVVDAPPGAGCPAIAAIRDTDYCVLVAEPTPLGLHDLKLFVELLRVFSTPFGVVINRCDIGSDVIEAYCHENGIPVLSRLPHDREVMELYSRGVPISKKSSAWRKKFLELYENVLGVAR